ncbi:MAG TPA: SDR family oxidoreductase [Pyrinomonadaceae bacterium]|nr:SDR family oxidoreductase [Pyrinomonadaceae bacterium]
MHRSRQRAHRTDRGDVENDSLPLPDRLLQMHDFWTSAGRLGRPEELAEYAAFMVSERNSFMNGEVVIVDGGAIT